MYQSKKTLTDKFEGVARALGIHANSVREMMKWMRGQPEVKYLREHYEEGSLPSWVGELGGSPPEEGPTTMEGDEEGPTSEEESDEEDPEIADGDIPVQASATGDVRKMVPLGAPSAKSVVPPKSSVVEGGDPTGGTPSGTPAGGDPPQKKEEPPPIVILEKKPRGKVKESEMQEVMTPTKLQLARNNMGNDPPTLRK